MIKEFKINAPILGKKVGDIIRVKTDKSGIPLDKEIRSFWRDSERDNCLEEIKIAKIKKERKENDEYKISEDDSK